MILVKDVIYEEVPGYTREVAIEHLYKKMENIKPWEVDIADEYFERKKEIVQGKEFRNAFHGDESIVIGWTEHVQKLLGLPFEAFDEMLKRNDELKHENKNLEMDVKGSERERDIARKELNEFKEMKFFKRLTFLIKGVNFKM